MNRNGFYAVLGLGVLVMGLIAWFGIRYHDAPRSEGPAATTTAAVSSENLAGKAIYSNGEYGFSLVYPESAKIDEAFKTYYHLPATWRANGAPDSVGTPVVAVVGYRIDNEKTYPRYFDTEVRIGVSADAKEVARCEKMTPDQGETVLPDAIINGITWKAFAFQDAAMMQYEKGISYRTVHEGKCYVMEHIQTGSNYRDDTKSAADISDETLQQRYQDLDAVVKSFTFARP